MAPEVFKSARIPVIIQPARGLIKYKNTMAIPENIAPTMCANLTACSSNIILLDLKNLSVVKVYSRTKGALLTFNRTDNTKIAKTIINRGLLCTIMDNHSNDAIPYLQKLNAPLDISTGLYSFTLCHPLFFLSSEKASQSFSCTPHTLENFAVARLPLALHDST